MTEHSTSTMPSPAPFASPSHLSLPGICALPCRHPQQIEKNQMRHNHLINIDPAGEAPPPVLCFEIKQLPSEVGDESDPSSSPNETSTSTSSVYKSPLPGPPPHMSFRGPINFLSSPIPLQTRNLIVSKLPAGNLAAVQEIVPTIPDQKLHPLSIDVVERLLEFQQCHYYWLEMRDLVWIQMILVEHSALFQNHRPIRDFVRAVHELKLLSHRITYSLRYMEGLARTRFPDLNLEEIVLNRHQKYGPDHPYKLIEPFLDSTKLHVYLDPYPGLERSRQDAKKSESDENEDLEPGWDKVDPDEDSIAQILAPGPVVL